jgi:PAS domain S-box-containing protein
VIGASIGLLFAIVIATGLNVWLVAEIRKEQRAVGEILKGGVQEDIRRLGTMPTELGWQLIFTIIVLIVLLVTAAILLFVVRAYIMSQTRLRDTVTLARDILESIDYGVITADTNRVVTSINAQACQLLAVEAESIGRSVRTVAPIGAELDDMCRQVMEAGTALHDQALLISQNGRRRELRADCYFLRGSNRQRHGTVLHVRDVTQQKLLEQRMRRMERFMGLGTLAAGLHHEIKNPLSALSLHVQLLEEGLPEQTDEPLLEHLGVLKTEVTRIAGVLESFRDYASLDQLNTAPLELREVVQQTIDLIRPQAQQQGVTVEWNASQLPNTLPVVMADAVRLEQVLLNLAINAMEAMRHGGCLTFSLQSSDDQIILSVADTGAGIPEEIEGCVLDPYFTTKNSGLGMGLAFCDKIVRQHGGQLSFDTCPRGTIFYLSLPTVK